MLKALSIQQPWAWCILRPDVLEAAARAKLLAAGEMKPVENRDWSTEYRGRLVIHAGKQLDHGAFDFLEQTFRLALPSISSLPRGGFVGYVDMVDCVDYYPSRWFGGPFGFVFANATPIAPQRGNGKLGLFPTAFSPKALQVLALT